MKLGTCLLTGTVLTIATVAYAQESREPRLWNPTFVYGSTTFSDSDEHQTFGAALRIRLSERWNVEPELFEC